MSNFPVIRTIQGRHEQLRWLRLDSDIMLDGENDHIVFAQLLHDDHYEIALYTSQYREQNQWRYADATHLAYTGTESGLIGFCEIELVKRDLLDPFAVLVP